MKPLVSIVFIIKYWGPMVDKFFEMIKSQKFKYPYELAAVYCGNDDHLYKKIKSLTSRVKKIAPEDYNCGITRDLSCSISTGKYIITLSVDSVPLNNYWLKNMIEPLMNNVADIVQGKIQCPQKGDPNYPDFFHWENDYGFYFTGEGKKFFKKYGNFGKYGSFGLAAPNLAFKREVWKRTGFGDIKYNEDNLFQRRIFENKFKVIYKENAVVLHAHSYKTIRPLFNRCSNEGLAWADLGEKYGFFTMIKDIFRLDLQLKVLLALIRGELKFVPEILFFVIRPVGLFWGSHYEKLVYSDER